MSREREASYDLTPRPLRKLTDREMRLALASVVYVEKVTTRYVLINLPIKRGVNACAAYIDGYKDQLSPESLYVCYRCLAWLSGEDDGTKPKEEDTQTCLL